MPLIEFPKNGAKPRVLNDNEMKAIGMMFWQSNILARRTLATWSVRKKKPTQDELLNLAQILDGAEKRAQEIASSPPSDGDKAIAWMKIIVRQIAHLGRDGAS